MKITKDIIDKFDQIVIKISKNLSNELIVVSDSEFYFKDLCICKQNDQLYTVCTKNTYDVFYSNVFLFSSALLIAISLNKKQYDILEKTIRYDNNYSMLYQKLQVYANSKKWDLYENCRIDADYILEYIHNEIFTNIR